MILLMAERNEQETARCDALLLKLLKTPPQPRPKRIRAKSNTATKAGKQKSGSRRQLRKG